MGNREERNEYATAKWDAEEVRRQASSEQRRHSDRRRQAKRNRTIIYLACVVLVSCLLAGIGWLLVNDVCSLNKPYTEVEITVEEGDSRGDVAKKLHDAGLVNSRLVFNIAGTFLHYNRYVEPGTYKLNSDMDFRALITNMHDWETDAKEAQGLIKVTIPEGYKLSDIAAAVATASEGRITAEAFTAAASDASVYAASYSFLADAGTNSLEGFLFPKTYAVADDATADSLVRMMLDQFQKETASLDWSYPQSQGLSIYDAVNLASIVEKESSGDEQIRAKVAAVFYNRLETTGEPSYGFLQSDATTAYEVGHDPTPEEVHAETPYSTYTNKGLPPTPICSPSLDCLKAVCAPDQESLGKYFFFYFEGDSYYFTETYEDHMNTFS